MNCISKTVRMPSDLVEFIDSCPCGDNFSQKLLGILQDYRYGDYSRQKNLEEYSNVFTNISQESGEAAHYLHMARSGIERMLRDLISVQDQLLSGAARADPPAADSVTGVNGVVE